MREPRNGPGAGTDALSPDVTHGGRRDRGAQVLSADALFPSRSWTPSRASSRPGRCGPASSSNSGEATTWAPTTRPRPMSSRSAGPWSCESTERPWTQSAGRTPPALCIECDVQVQRLALPGNEVAGVSQAYQIHTRSKPTLQVFDVTPAAAGGDGLDRSGPRPGARRRDPQADRAKARSIDDLLFTIYYLGFVRPALCSARPQIVNSKS